MPAKKATSVNEQILVEAARIYDARGDEGVDAKVYIAYYLDVL